MTATDPFELAHRYGVDILLSDLGEVAERILVAEYEPDPPRIRINTRAIERAAALAADGPAWCDPVLVARCAVAHELYHHREYLGEVERFADRNDRERAANDFARALLALEVPVRLIAEALR